MKKSLYPAVSLLLFLAACLTSCDETDAVDRYAGWQSRNEVFLDSIAREANSDTSGEWVKCLSYTLPQDEPGDIPLERPIESYVYAKKIHAAEGTDHPDLHIIYTDSVYVHFRGKLINGDVFQEATYEGGDDPDFAISTPTKMAVSASIVGFATALQHMRIADRLLPEWQYKGDYWQVYIPYQLGYGTTANDDIPAYSVLVFDMAVLDKWEKGTPAPPFN